MSEYLGSPQTMGEAIDIATEKLAPLPHLDLGWPFQCRCGSTEWVSYRGRYYSPCGRRYPNPDVKLGADHPTFRDRFVHLNHHRMIEERVAAYRGPHERNGRGRYRKREEFKRAVWSLVGHLRQFHGWRAGSVGKSLEDLEFLHERAHEEGE